ncbi:MAG: MFS transporter [Nitrososphaerota archaeon]|jgi:putative MFS transporter|nr:MFS transporter [Nitrososphaerota archaeon]MDG6932416.1 MFS transporter [Nitrososphaerota archaeon]
MSEESTATEELSMLEAAPPRSYLTRLIALLGTGTFFDSYDAIVIGSVLPVLISVFSLSSTYAGLLIAITYVGEFLGAIVFGYISEKYGRKTAYIVSIIEYSVFFVITAAAASFGMLLALRLLSGLGLGGEVPVAAAMVNEFAGTKKRGKLVLLYQSVFPWGFLIAPLLASFIYSYVGVALGWRVLFLIGIIPLIAGIASIFALWESPRWLINRGKYESAQRVINALGTGKAQLNLEGVDLKPKPPRFSELFSRQYRIRTALVWAMWFTAYFINYGMLTWLPTLYVKVGGLPLHLSLMMTALVSGLILIVTYIVVAVIDAVGRKPLAITGFTIALAGLAYGSVMTLAYHDAGWQVLLTTSALTGVGITGIIALLLYVYTSELYPTRMRSWGTSVGSSILRVATVISTYLVGAIFAASYGYLGMGHVFVMFAVIALAGLVLVTLFGIETKRRLLEAISP